MANSNHNDTVLSYDELGFIIGMKRVEKKLVRLIQTLKRSLVSLLKALKSKKHNLHSLSLN